jgi:hypothetical protein
MGMYLHGEFNFHFRRGTKGAPFSDVSFYESECGPRARLDNSSPGVLYRVLRKGFGLLPTSGSTAWSPVVKCL